MSRTPEGKIKDMVNKALNDFEGEVRDVNGYMAAEIYRYWPVPSGFGSSTLDCLVTYRGITIGIETKAPGKKLTSRQRFTKAQLNGAGARVFEIDGEEGVLALRTYLMQLRFRNADDSK